MLSVMTKPLSTTPKFFLVLIFLVEFCFIEIAETKGSSSSGGSRRIHYNGGSGGGGFFGGAFGWIGYIVLLLQIFGLIVAILKCYLACTESSRRSCYLCLESDMSIEEWDKHREEGQCPELFRYLGCEITPWVRCGKCNGPLRQLWLSSLAFDCDAEDGCKGVKKKNITSLFTYRFNCFKCDFDICQACVESRKMGSKIQSQNEEMLSSNADHLSRLSGRQISIEASIDPQHSLKDTSNGNQESIEDPETYKQPLLYENYHPNPNLSLSRGSFHNFLEPEPCGIWQKKENCQSNFPKSQQQYVNAKLLVSTV